MPVSPGLPLLRFQMPPAGPVFPKSDPGSRPRFIQFIDLIDSQINASSEVVNRKSEKKQHRLINKKKTQKNWFPRIQHPWEVFSAESQFCQSSVWLYRAFSPGNIRLPPALSGGTTLRRAVKTWGLSYDIVIFFSQLPEAPLRNGKTSALKSRKCLGSCTRCKTIHHAEGSTICKMWGGRKDVFEQWRSSYSVQHRIVQATTTC